VQHSKHEDYQDLLQMSDVGVVYPSGRMAWRGICRVLREMHTGFWWGNLREVVGLEEVDIDGR